MLFFRVLSWWNIVNICWGFCASNDLYIVVQCSSHDVGTLYFNICLRIMISFKKGSILVSIALRTHALLHPSLTFPHQHRQVYAWPDVTLRELEAEWSCVDRYGFARQVLWFTKGAFSETHHHLYGPLFDFVRTLHELNSTWAECVFRCDFLVSWRGKW